MKKSLKTNNFLIGFIIVMISIIPVSSVKAYDDDIIKKCADWANGKLSDLLGSDVENAVVFYNHNDNTYYVPIKQTIYNASIFKTEGWYASYYSNHFIIVSPNWYRLYLYKYNASSDSFTKVTATNWYTGSSSSIILDSSSYDFELVYADRDIIFKDWVPSGTYKGTTYYTGDIFYDSPSNNPEISFQVNPLEGYCNGRDCTSITTVFGNVEGSDYTYQIKTDHIDWTTISLNSSYEYEYYLEYNSTFYARILDSSGDTVVENSINITGLNDFGITIDKFGYGDDQGRELAQFIINFENCWNETYIYQYSFNNVDFVNMDVSEERKYKLYQGINTDIYFRILNSSGNVIYTLKDEKLTQYGNYSWLYDIIERNAIIKETTKINSNNQKEIVVSVDFSEFSQFSDMYDLKFYINDEIIDSGNKTLVYTKENFVTGFYIKVELDGIELKNHVHRIAANDSGGGSDGNFNDTYHDIIEDNLEKDFIGIDYETVQGMIEAIKKFIYSIEDLIVIFFGFVDVFLDRLNPYTRTLILCLFIILVISKIVKAVRR